MARELDLQRVHCDQEDGRLAVAFGYWEYPYPQVFEWEAFCQPCLDQYADHDDLCYVRFRVDPVGAEQEAPR